MTPAGGGPGQRVTLTGRKEEMKASPAYRYGWPSMQKWGHFSDRVSEMDSDARNKKGLAGTLRLPEESKPPLTHPAGTRQPEGSYRSNAELPCDLAIPLCTPQAGSRHTNKTPMFTAASFATVERGKQHKCASADEQINKMQYCIYCEGVI